MADVVYNSFPVDLMNADIDLAADTIKVALVTSSYTPDQDAHNRFDDVTNEVTGTGYTAGGATLANKAVTQDNTDNEAVFDADNVTWSSSTITARGAVVYKSTGTASTSPLIKYIDFGGNIASSASDFTLTFNAEGIININT
jgi:hypothetical protein